MEKRQLKKQAVPLKTVNVITKDVGKRKASLDKYGNVIVNKRRNYEKKMVILVPSIELNSVIWIDENNELQIKPTWDCVIIINAKNMSVTVRDAEDVVGLP
ncbi:MAG: hypothetical protein ACQEUO_12745 [Bacillota bacterium]|nr:hypothetical protein [Bacillus pumilus]